ncbi:ATPase, T2SS/T4P/T4SS family [[Bacillus] enclensis]|uniref:ATPase, T2SS/T4P/T4SS family n=1 Tax=[Bacillus] enclensis TaxID=1402860 RepID=UPI001146E06E
MGSIIITSHLVLTTLHTKDAKSAVYRLMELGVHWHDIQQTLIGVSAQRLLKLKCSVCETDCNTDCKGKGPVKRASVYEIVTGSALKEVIKEARGEDAYYQYPTLRTLINKGVALGFVPDSEFRKWIHEENG